MSDDTSVVILNDTSRDVLAIACSEMFVYFTEWNEKYADCRTMVKKDLLVHASNITRSEDVKNEGLI